MCFDHVYEVDLLSVIISEKSILTLHFVFCFWQQCCFTTTGLNLSYRLLEIDVSDDKLIIVKYLLIHNVILLTYPQTINKCNWILCRQGPDGLSSSETVSRIHVVLCTSKYFNASRSRGEKSNIVQSCQNNGTFKGHTNNIPCSSDPARSYLNKTLQSH